MGILIIVYHNHGNGTKKPGTIVVWYNGSIIGSWLFTMVVFHHRHNPTNRGMCHCSMAILTNYLPGTFHSDLPGNLPVLLWHVINLQESAGATNCRLVDLDSFAAYTIHTYNIYIYIHTHTHFPKIDFAKY